MSSYKNIDLDTVKKEFNQLMKEFDPQKPLINPLDFQQFINGFFQAEGTISLYFREPTSLGVIFYFAIGQNYTPEVARLFILLQHYLGGIGRFKFEELPNGNKHIRFVVTDIQVLVFID